MTTVGVLLPVGFGGADTDQWPRPRSFPRAEELERPLDVLPGVGPAVKKKLERLGLEPHQRVYVESLHARTFTTAEAPVEDDALAAPVATR